MTEHDLKKQSQFVVGQMNVSALQGKDYVNEHGFEERENKASQSQRPAFGRKLEAPRAFPNDRPPLLVILRRSRRIWPTQ
ncbi:MAG: hypothetical protein ACYSYV_10585 [Planctomycetota bacterium]